MQSALSSSSELHSSELHRDGEDGNMMGKKNNNWSTSFYLVTNNNTIPHSDAHDDQTNDDFVRPFFHELQSAIRHYREMADRIIRQLSISHEVAYRTEHLLFPHHHSRIITKCNEQRSLSLLSCKLEHKIAESARLLEHNCDVLESLLKSFPVIEISPHNNTTTASSSNFTFPLPSCGSDHVITESFQRPIQSLARYIPPYTNIVNEQFEEEPYDTATHVITHLSRDWTENGESIRQDTYYWIVDQLCNYHTSFHDELKLDTEHDQLSPLSPVLVPGAGMARLAFDIAFVNNRNDINGRRIKCNSFVVEAVDNSVVMAAATYHVLHHAANRRTDDTVLLTVYPFVSDPLTNEVDTQRRWESAEFPEEKITKIIDRLALQHSYHKPNLSYVIGDFVSIYSSPSKHGMYGSIATCYFIDTATNIYEYILTIRNLLRVGGVWINLGPVQWHRNAQLQPSTDELKDMILLAGFTIVHWEISDKLLAYRHPLDILSGTRVEAYRPLKFVVVLGSNGFDVQDETTETPHDDLLSSLQKLHQVTGRRTSMV